MEENSSRIKNEIKSIETDGSNILKKAKNMIAISNKLISKFKSEDEFVGQQIWQFEYRSQRNNWEDLFMEVLEISSNLLIAFGAEVLCFDSVYRGESSVLCLINAINGEVIDYIKLECRILKFTINSDRTLLYLILDNNELVEVNLPILKVKRICKLSIKANKITCALLIENKGSIAISDIDGNLSLIDINDFVTNKIYSQSLPIGNLFFLKEYNTIIIFSDDSSIVKLSLDDEKIGSTKVKIIIPHYSNARLTHEVELRSNNYYDKVPDFDKSRTALYKITFSINLAKNIIAVALDRDIHILNLSNLTTLKIIKDSYANSMVFSDNGNYLAHSYSEQLIVRDTQDFEKIINLSDFSDWADFDDDGGTWYNANKIFGINFSLDSKSIYGASICCILKFN